MGPNHDNMHCMHCDMPRRICCGVATFNSEKSSLYIALAVIELNLSEGISKLVSKLASRKFQ